MGLFSRRRNDDRPEVDDALGRSMPEESEGPELPADGRPVSGPLRESDRARIEAALATLASRGVGVDDLAAVAASYDQALALTRAGAGDPAGVVVELFGVAIGEHLARHSARSWAVVTDVFGTDLGLVAARADAVVVPHNLVSARWMRGETGWIPGVVTHLASLHPRR